MTQPGWRCRSVGGPTTRPQWRNCLASGPQATQGSPTITHWARPCPQLPGALSLREGVKQTHEDQCPQTSAGARAQGGLVGKGRPFSEEADPAKAGGWGPHEETRGVCVIKPLLHAAGTPETHQPPTPVLPNQHKLKCKCRPLPATTSSGEAPQGRGFVYPHTPAGLRGTRAAPLEYQDPGGEAAQSGGVSLGLPPRSLAHHTVWAPGKLTGTICTSHHVCFTTALLRPLDSKVSPAAAHSPTQLSLQGSGHGAGRAACI